MANDTFKTKADEYTYKYAWYPKSNFLNYVYAASLKGEKNRGLQSLYRTAQICLYSSHNNLNRKNVFKNAFNNLGNLAESERKAELDYIKHFLNINIAEDDITTLVDVINEMLNNKEISDKTIESLRYSYQSQYGEKIGQTQLFKQISEEIPKQIDNVLENFKKQYLNTEILELSNDKLQEKLETYVIEHLYKYFQKEVERYNTGRASDPYFQVLEQLSHTGGLQSLAVDLTNAFHVKIELEEKTQSKRKKKINQNDVKSILTRTHAKGQKGTLFEIIYNNIYNSFEDVSNMSTATLNNQKADTILFQYTGGIDTDRLEKIFNEKVTEISKETASKRIQNIEAIQTMKKALGDFKGGIVEISDKNYTLNSSYFAANHGFSAEKPTLNNFQQLMKRSNIETAVDDMVFILANSGPGLINDSNYNDVMQVISLSIAQFLFDDVAITDALDDYKSNLRVLHLFNLNGILIPLSVFLQAAYTAFSNNYSQLTTGGQKYVSVSFNPGGYGTAPNVKNDALTESDWNEYYQQQLTHKTVSIHFFGDFIKFIRENIRR